jgi:glycogen synthase
MAADFSWSRVAQQFVELYQKDMAQAGVISK